MFFWLGRFWRWLRCQICRLIGRLRFRNEIGEQIAECIYGWSSGYRIEDVGDCTVRITVRIQLNPDPDVTADEIATLRLTWEQGIEDTWSNRFQLVKTAGNCVCCPAYSVEIDVQFVDSSPHHVVRVRTGPARSNMTTWDTADSGGTAAHEFGHMLGFPDEYPDDNCPDRVVTTDGSIMRSTAGSVRPRHYEPFARWISGRTCCVYAVQ